MKCVSTFLAFILLLFSACKKNESLTEQPNNSLIEQAKAFFSRYYSTVEQQGVETNGSQNNKSPRLNTPRTPIWEKAYCFEMDHKKAVIVPVQYAKDFLIGTNFSGEDIFSINDITKLCIYQDKQGNFKTRWLSFFPDSNYKIGDEFSGVIFEDSWSGDPINKYKIDKGHEILEWNGSDSAEIQSSVQTQSTPEPNLLMIATCSTIYGYNYSVDDPSGGVPWSEPAGCNYIFVGNGGTEGLSPSAIATIPGGGGPGTIISPAKTIIVTGGTNAIGNIVDYDKCFTNIAGSGHVYTVTVCVDQPVPGSRQSWGISVPGAAESSGGSNPVNVGHVFLVFKEDNGSISIARNVGFYPQGKVSPLSPSNPGQMNDDEQHGYNISLTVTITNSQFFNMLNFVQQSSINIYNLNSFNCTSFAIQAFNAGSVILPSTIGQWSGGAGNDPGDLGEDIRAMTLSAKMTMNTQYVSHSNIGNCN
jgi:hypothetical protein